MKNTMKKTRKVLSVVLSLALLALCFSIPMVASADSVVTKRGLSMTAPLDGGFVNSLSVNGMHQLFQKYGISSTTFQNSSQSKSTFLQKITTTFSAADSSDISYIYIQSHGDEDGNLYVSSPALTLQELKTTLDQIPGKKVVFINACYSGQAIAPSNISDLPMEDVSDNIIIDTDYSQLMLENFLGSENVTDSGEFRGAEEYMVFCSSTQTEQSFSTDNYGGFAPYAWARGSGYNITTGNNCTKYADTNGDDTVSALELQLYAYDLVLDLAEDAGVEQHCFAYAAFPYSSAFYTNYPVGDVNLDGMVAMADVLAVRKHIAGTAILTGTALQLADFNGDNTIDMKDVLALQNYIAAV